MFFKLHTFGFQTPESENENEMDQLEKQFNRVFI